MPRKGKCMLEKGVEPLLLAEYAPEAYVSASSTTRARYFCEPHKKEFTTYIKKSLLQTHVGSLLPPFTKSLSIIMYAFLFRFATTSV